jgi:organic radical activating enzyme
MQVIPINTQPIEKSVKSDGSVLDVHSIFYTIQGEGPFTGRPAVFVRLAGCNLQCPSCDTEYTKGRLVMNVESILDSIKTQSTRSHRKPLIVITGGEPFRQSLLLLCALLVKHEYTVQIETNGTLAPGPGTQDHPVWEQIHIVCSPKAGKVQEWIRSRAKCFKYVLSHDSVNPNDGLPILALNHTAAPQVARHGGKPVYLQPMDSKDEATNAKNIKAVVDSCLRFGYTLQLQTHKYLGVE